MEYFDGVQLRNSLILTLKKASQKLLSNHAMQALNNLILKSKKHFASYKVSDILENQAHAWELLLLAVTSGNAELRQLAKIVNHELKIAPNLIGAVNNYIEQIHQNKISAQFFEQSQHYLKLFATHLYEVVPNNDAYREASSLFLASLNKKDHTFCVNMIRSFYPHWQQGNGATSHQKSLNASNVADHTKGLMNLWKDIDAAFITTIEEALISHYQQAIKKIDINEEEVKLRTKIVKVILLMQRKHDKTANGYRTNIAHIQSAFTNQDLLRYFLSVSREFYHVWENAILNKN
jgi:hypothetical protein